MHDEVGSLGSDRGFDTAGDGGEPPRATRPLPATNWERPFFLIRLSAYRPLAIGGRAESCKLPSTAPERPRRRYSPSLPKFPKLLFDSSMQNVYNP